MGLHPRQPSVAAAGTADAATGATSTGLGYDAHDMRWNGRWMVLVLAVSGLAVALSVAFVWLHVAGPSDGARMQPGRRTWAHGGVVLSPLATRPGGLASGDVVVAVDGRPMRAWEQGLVAPHAPHPRWQVGQTVTYSVQRHGRLLDVPVRLRSYPWRGLVQQGWSMLLYFLVFALVGTYVFIRRPADRAAKVLFVSTSTLLAANVVWSFGLQVTDITGGVGFWLSTTMALVVNPICWAGFLHFVLLFPRVHPVLAGRRWIIPSLYLVAVPCSLASLAVFRAMTPGTLDWLEPWGLGSNTVILGYMALIVLVLWSNLRAPLGAVAHQQLRWIVFAGLVSGGGDLMLWILPASVLGHPVISLNVLGLVLLPIPLALAVAILRYHVFDIDVLINRAMVYGTLTAILGLGYAGVVLAAGQLLGSDRSNLAVAGATLAMAAAFQPARRHVQATVDRRFNRRRYDAAKTIAAFSVRLREELDLDTLTAELLAVVDQTMEPTQVSLWLRPSAPGSSGTPRSEARPTTWAY
jgi:two-component system, NarL family, sensor kinase